MKSSQIHLTILNSQLTTVRLSLVPYAISYKRFSQRAAKCALREMFDLRSGRSRILQAMSLGRFARRSVNGSSFEQSGQLFPHDAV